MFLAFLISAVVLLLAIVGIAALQTIVLIATMYLVHTYGSDKLGELDLPDFSFDDVTPPSLLRFSQRIFLLVVVPTFLFFLVVTLLRTYGLINPRSEMVPMIFILLYGGLLWGVLSKLIQIEPRKSALLAGVATLLFILEYFVLIPTSLFKFW